MAFSLPLTETRNWPAAGSAARSSITMKLMVKNAAIANRPRIWGLSQANDDWLSGRVLPSEGVHGYVAADENRIQVVQARAAGYVEKLHVRAENDPVRIFRRSGLSG